MLPQEERDRLVTDNLGLVHFFALRYKRRNIELDDLIQEGTIGMIRAAEKYDPARGKFVTYAAHHVIAKIRAHVQRQGHEAVARPLWTKAESSEARNAAYYNTFQPVIRFNRRNGGGGSHGTTSEATILDIFPDPDAIMPDEFMDPEHVAEMVNGALACCKPRDRALIEQRFGIHGGDGLTLEEVGFLNGITRERVRQLCNRGFVSMRRYLKRRGLNLDA